MTRPKKEAVKKPKTFISHATNLERLIMRPGIALTILMTVLFDHGWSRTAVEPGNAGGRIALTLRDQTGKLQIFAIAPDGTDREQLTFEGENGRPDWSPDGKQIAFMSIQNERSWVGVMDAHGSARKLLTEGFAPDWSPDGGQIAFSRPDGQIWVINGDGSEDRQITQSDTYKAGPSWSPDGKQMVFILVKNPGSQSDPQLRDRDHEFGWNQRKNSHFGRSTQHPHRTKPRYNSLRNSLRCQRAGLVARR